MSTLYEYHNTGDNNFISLANLQAQTFTPSSSHTITSIKLLLYKSFGSPSIMTIGIKATNGGGHPTGNDLCSGTTEGNTLTEDTDGEWREITLGAGTKFTADIKYAIVVDQTGFFPNLAYWRMSGNVYADGNREEYSVGAWVAHTNDCMFEEWGDPISVVGSSMVAKMMAAGVL